MYINSVILNFVEEPFHPLNLTALIVVICLFVILICIYIADVVGTCRKASQSGKTPDDGEAVRRNSAVSEDIL